MARLKLFFALARCAARAEGQYRANFFLSLLAGALYQTVTLGLVGVIIGRIGSLAGWSLDAVLLLYGMRLTSHGLWISIFSQLVVFDNLVRSGEVERFFVRPAGVLLQVVTRRAGVMQFGDLLAGVCLLTVSLYRTSAVDDFGAALYLVASILAGAFLELGFVFAVMSLSFRWKSVQVLRISFDYVFGTFGSFPTGIFVGLIRYFLILCVPVAFVSYIPATILLGRSEVWPNWTSSIWPLSPLVGLVFLIMGHRLWRRGLLRYEGTGG